MKMSMTILALSAFLAAAGAAFGQASNAADAEQMFKKSTSNATWKWGYTGEQFGWNTNGDLHSFLRKYKVTKDEAYLDAGVKYYDAILAKMDTGPDGFKGYIGPFVYRNEVWCDVHVGDALIFEGILDFGATVMREPKLKEKYGAKALEYAAVVKKNFFEKWAARGTWHEDGPFGFYVAWDKYGAPHEFKDWKVDEKSAGSSDNSLPFNKQIDCGALAINLWQITGDETYKHTAEKLYGFMKSRMQKFNGAYHWNYWEPAGQWDLGATPADIKAGEWNPKVANKTMRHWIQVHGHRNYQSNEMNNIVKAYNAGIVFTEEDIKGMIQTNLKVMWNGDEAKPQYANSNADLMQLLGKADAYHPPGTKDIAGEAWAPLGQFDAQIRKLASRRGDDNGPAISFDRRDVSGKVELPAAFAQFPMGNIRTVHAACVLPSVFVSGETAAVFCKLLENGELEVSLYSADGKAKIATLKKGNVEGGHDGRDGVNYFLWNGTDPVSGNAFESGNYRIRWTVTNDGYRELPITILPKK